MASLAAPPLPPLMVPPQHPPPPLPAAPPPPPLAPPPAQISSKKRKVGNDSARISTADEWTEFQRTGATLRGDLDRSTGCIHLSDQSQVTPTLICLDFSHSQAQGPAGLGQRAADGRTDPATCAPFLSELRGSFERETFPEPP